MEEDFKEFIESRVNGNIQHFSNDKSYNNLYNEFSNAYDSLYNILPTKEKQFLENLYALFNDLSSYEQYISYKIGFADGMELKKDLKKVASV